jgi:hypothetical protein
VAALGTGADDEERSTLLHILGQAGAFDQRSLVEGYLTCPDDPFDFPWLC